MACAVARTKSLRDLRDVFRLRLRPVFLLHVAAYLLDQGAGLLAILWRLVCGAAVPAGRPRRSRWWTPDRSVVAPLWSARRTLLPRMRVVRLRCDVSAGVDGGGVAGGEGHADRACP